MKRCKRCGTLIKSYSPMRKWCVDCRKVISLEQAKARRTIIVTSEKEAEKLRKKRDKKLGKVIEEN